MSVCLAIHRVSHSLAGQGLLGDCASSFLRHLNQFLFACHIGSYAEIGTDCILQHNGMGLVISDHARIGKGCTIFHGVTIGVKEDGQTIAPTIGDGVVIGAGAILLGGISVGNRARIGAGSVVLSDVGEDATVVGNPARLATRRSADG